MASIINVDKVRATGSTTDGLVVDSSGRVQLPQTPAFFARAATLYSQTGIIKYNDVTNTGCFNQGGHYSTSTYKFTAPVDGIYSFSNQVYSEGATLIQLFFYINTDVVAGSQENAGTDDNYEGISLPVTVQLSASDTVYYSTSTTTHHTNSGYSFFCGHLVG